MRSVPWVFGCALACQAWLVLSQYSATYVPGEYTLPQTTEEGQIGTNQCGTGSSDSSMCQNLYVNSATDFCLWGPKGPQPQGVGDSEREVVSYCTKAGRGTRLIPPGTIQSVHFVRTPHYIQISGSGKLSNLHITGEDGGGELDPHGQDGLGNPIGGLVFTNAFGKHLVQAHEWTSFMDDTTFCMRVCADGEMASTYCKHIYDELGCQFNMPTGPDQPGVFETCEGPDADIVGVYTENGVPSTFFQTQTKTGEPVPPPKPPAPLSKCKGFDPQQLQGSLQSPYANAGKAGHQQLRTSRSMRSSQSGLFSSSSYQNSSSSSFNSNTLFAPTSTSSSFMTSSPSTTSSPTSKSVVTVTSTPQGKQPFEANGAGVGFFTFPNWYLPILAVLMSSVFLLV